MKALTLAHAATEEKGKLRRELMDKGDGVV
jgi:hypothetical protein